VIKKVLNIYLEKGTQDSLMILNKSLKFFKVGFLTKKRGGKYHISSRGFSELEIAYTIGRTMNNPKNSKNK
jgi:hypothetical protein